MRSAPPAGRFVTDLPTIRYHLCACLAVLTALLWAVPASATFPGPNGKLVFERTQMYTVNPDGSALTAITPSNWRAREPAWSPDGRQIAFQYSPAMSTAPPGWGIWVMSRNGTNARQITRDPQTVAANDTYPAWSPDAARILFVRDSDLYVMNADGTGVTNLTSTFARGVIDPEWSPNGDLIAFSDGGDIYLIGPTGTPAPRLLTTTPGNQRYPSWAPDGSAIAYAEIGEVSRINPDGSNDVVLTSGLREVWDVAWSPDSTRIAFVNDPGDNIAVQEELFMMNADGTGLTRLGVDTSINLDWGVFAPDEPVVPAPVVGETVTAGVASGKVFIKKGSSFVPLTEDRSIPVGSTLDTRQGTVELSSARDAAGSTQSGKFSAGVFQVLQSRAAKAKGLTELRLKGSAAKFRRCRSTNATASRLSRRAIRRLRGNARGRFRTRGRHSAATVRGTVWEVTDRCDGTLTKVRRGKVAVRDFRRRKTIVVAAGKQYLARAQP